MCVQPGHRLTTIRFTGHWEKNSILISLILTVILKRYILHFPGYMDANDPDLTRFFARGGKLMIVSGTADACVLFPDAWHYAMRVMRKIGAEAARISSVSIWCRHWSTVLRKQLLRM